MSADRSSSDAILATPPSNARMSDCTRDTKKLTASGIRFRLRSSAKDAIARVFNSTSGLSIRTSSPPDSREIISGNSSPRGCDEFADTTTCEPFDSRYSRMSRKNVCVPGLVSSFSIPSSTNTSAAR